MMEQIVCVVTGVGLLLAGVVLSRVRSPDWTNKHLNENEQQRVNSWGKLQSRVRWCNNCVISFIGAVIVMTAALPHGRVWAILWAVVALLLLLVILLAFVDALVSFGAYQRTLPSTMRATLGDDSKEF